MPLVVLLALLAAPLHMRAQTQQLRERLQSLDSSSVSERREALNWLAHYGAFTGVATIVKSLKDEDQGVRSLAEQALWAIWSRSGSPHVDDLLSTGGHLMSQGSLWQAVQFFDEVISQKPGFAEGYNKRATAWYLLGSYKKSLADIDLTLDRNPYHFGALSGAGYCMIRLKRYGEAVVCLQRALKINPNLEGVRELIGALTKQLQRNAI
jgi:tetratricopeptide (TPR) repeat protein